MVPLEISHRKLDGQVNHMRGPGYLCIDGPPLNPEEGGTVFFFVPERQSFTGDLPHDFLGDATHRGQDCSCEPATMPEQPHDHRLPKVHGDPPYAEIVVVV